MHAAYKQGPILPINLQQELHISSEQHFIRVSQHLSQLLKSFPISLQQKEQPLHIKFMHYVKQLAEQHFSHPDEHPFIQVFQLSMHDLHCKN